MHCFGTVDFDEELCFVIWVHYQPAPLLEQLFMVFLADLDSVGVPFIVEGLLIVLLGLHLNWRLC